MRKGRAVFCKGIREVGLCELAEREPSEDRREGSRVELESPRGVRDGRRVGRNSSGLFSRERCSREIGGERVDLTG
jgi:hypothetical protein